MPRYTKPLESLRRDTEVLDELRDLFASRKKVDELDQTQEVRPVNRKAIVEFLEEPIGPLETHGTDDSFFSEAIVLAVGRPSVLIQDGELKLSDVRLTSVRDRLKQHQATIEPRLPSVGRVELRSHPDFEWVGTGWLLEGGIIITNRHVATVFANRQGSGYRFRRFMGQDVSAGVDFREEYQRQASMEIEVADVLYIAPSGRQHPDIAILKLHDPDSIGIAPLELAEHDPKEQDHIGVVGYPAWDGRRNPGPEMSRIFKDIYDVKRFAPGLVADVRNGLLTHDCSTLGGNSGSPLLAMETGKVVGLHFAGRFMSENFALPVSIVKRELSRLRTQVAVTTDPLPLESLEDRQGFDEAFLGTGRLRVPMPTLSRQLMEDAATVRGRERDRGLSRYVLDYTHFSVVMNKRRRLAFYTAVNIDGTQEVAVRRSGTRWRTDPRIRNDHQYDNELYYRNKLDRGHLVRRLDPVWGSVEVARQANADTYHYTNAAPQHERLNQREWLALEDYLLQNTNDDDQKLTVFTGPVFTECDKAYRGTTLPQDFWKVAVMNLEGRLRATAYLLSQKQFMDDLEFVIGEFRTYQVPIHEIENMTGIRFGDLTEFDPLADSESFGFNVVSGPDSLVI